MRLLIEIKKKHVCCYVCGWQWRCQSRRSWTRHVKIQMLKEFPLTSNRILSLGSTETQVRSPAQHTGIRCCRTCGLGGDCRSDLIPGLEAPYAREWLKMWWGGGWNLPPQNTVFCYYITTLRCLPQKATLKGFFLLFNTNAFCDFLLSSCLMSTPLFLPLPFSACVKVFHIVSFMLLIILQKLWSHFCLVLHHVPTTDHMASD